MAQVTTVFVHDYTEDPGVVNVTFTDYDRGGVIYGTAVTLVSPVSSPLKCDVLFYGVDE